MIPRAIPVEIVNREFNSLEAQLAESRAEVERLRELFERQRSTLEGLTEGKTSSGTEYTALHVAMTLLPLVDATSTEALAPTRTEELEREEQEHHQEEYERLVREGHDV